MNLNALCILRQSGPSSSVCGHGAQLERQASILALPGSGTLAQMRETLSGQATIVIPTQCISR